MFYLGVDEVCVGVWVCGCGCENEKIRGLLILPQHSERTPNSDLCPWFQTLVKCINKWMLFSKNFCQENFKTALPMFTHCLSREQTQNLNLSFQNSALKNRELLNFCEAISYERCNITDNMLWVWLTKDDWPDFECDRLKLSIITPRYWPLKCF